METIKIPVIALDESCAECPLIELKVDSLRVDDFFGEYTIKQYVCKNLELCERLRDLLNKNGGK